MAAQPESFASRTSGRRAAARGVVVGEDGVRLAAGAGAELGGRRRAEGAQLGDVGVDAVGRRPPARAHGSTVSAAPLMRHGSRTPHLASISLMVAAAFESASAVAADGGWPPQRALYSRTTESAAAQS